MICQDSDVLQYLQNSGLVVPPGVAGFVSLFRPAVERRIKEYVGYEIEQQSWTEYYPEKRVNVRAEADETGYGFDLAGGVVVQRAVSSVVRREFVLKQLPVRSITSVWDNPAAFNTPGGTWPDSSLLPGQAYYLDDSGDGFCWSGILYRNVGVWSLVPRTIKVTYTAGLTAEELLNKYPEFRAAVLSTCATTVGAALARAKMAITGMIPGSTGIEDFSVAFVAASNGFLGSFNGTGVGTSPLPTEVQQMLYRYRNMANIF